MYYDFLFFYTSAECVLLAMRCTHRIVNVYLILTFCKQQCPITQLFYTVGLSTALERRTRFDRLLMIWLLTPAAAAALTHLAR
jgi:hypothetical protein